MEYPFQDLVDLNKIQQMLNIFSRFAGVNIAVFDGRGSVLPEAGWQKICSQFHQNNSICAEMCRNSYKQINVFDEGKDLNIDTCPNGLIHMTAPVIIQGEHVATVLASQFLLATPELEAFRVRAREYGFDVDEYIKAVNELPVINQNHAERISEFLGIFAKLLGEMGLEKLLQLQALQKQLYESKQHLRFIGQQLPGAVWATDTNLCYTFHNHGATPVGHPYENIIGRTLFERLHTDDPDHSIIVMHREALAGKTVNSEINYENRLWETHIEPLFDERGTIVGTLGIGIDISERKRMEQVLQESEKMYRELFDNAAILLFTTDLEGQFTSVNKYGLVHFGYELDEIIGVSIFDMVRPEDKEMVRAKVDEKLGGKDITTYNTEIIDHDGKKRVIELHTRLIYDGEKPVGIQGAGRDITQQKQMQEALEASEQKFRTLAEDSAAIVYILQANQFVYVNPALIRLSGYSEEELLNMNFWDIMHPDYREMARQRGLARQLDVDGPATYELKLLSKNNEAVWIYLTGSRFIYEGEPAVMASAIDITELKRGEDALQESQTLLNHIIDFLPDATLVINIEGQILFWNRAMEKMTGVEAKYMLGKDNFEHAIPFYGERRPILIDMVFATDNRIRQQYSLINRTDDNLAVEIFVPTFGSDGAYLWGFATPLYNAQGDLIGAIETIRDISEYKHMENELINQANSLKMTLEQSPTGTAIVDQNQNFIFLNSRFIEITGYTLEDIPTMEIWEHKAYLNEKSRRVLHDDWAKQLAVKKKGQGIARVRRKDGKIRDVEFHGIRLPDGRTIISVWDVTWQKQVEENLRAGERRFRALSDASFEGIILSENGICVEVNNKAIEMFGYSQQEMVGMSILDLTALESRVVVKNYLNNEYELPYEAVGVRKDGRQLPIEIQGRMFEYQGRLIRATAIWDLSERQQVEAELSRERQNLQALFFNSPDALVLCNLEREILDVNPQFYNLFGYTLEECQSQQIKELIVPGDYLNEYWEHDRQLTDGKTVQKETVRMHKNGKRIDVALRTVAIINYGFYVLYSDITERKQAEQTINEQVKELEAKNAEMERFTYTVSHDLRSPLITIKGFAGLLMEDLSQGNHSRLEKDLQRIINAADKMDDLLRDLLELSRIGRMLNAFSRFSMTKLATEVVELLTGRLKERGVILSIAPDMPIVNADLVRIREVLQNLLENAIKFMGNQTHPQIDIGFTDNSGEWAFFIRDNGIGIESRYHDSIFGLFNKLDPNCEGTGIGLSLVKRIIEFHHGRIWVESKGTGQGSTFYFTLPKMAEK